MKNLKNQIEDIRLSLKTKKKRQKLNRKNGKMNS